MANTIRIKRRASGAAGAPATLKNAELAYNEVDDVLYYGKGDSGGDATTIEAIAGKGAVVTLTGDQTIAGTKTFSSTISGSVSGNAGTATTLATSRNFSVSGDAATSAPVAFNGSAAVDLAVTLATQAGLVAGSYTKLTVNTKGLVTAGTSATLADLGTTTANFSMNGFQITNLADPTLATDAATKGYVDGVAQGLDVKASVLWSTTGDITLSGLATQANGEWTGALTDGDRILVKNQAAPADNGIYLAHAAGWTRALDADAWTELVSAFTFVEKGATLADTGWVCTADAGGTLGVTALPWTKFSSAGSYTNGDGLNLVGNTFSVKLDGTTLALSASGVKVSDTYPGNTSLTTVGTVTTGTWDANTIAVTAGGTGIETATTNGILYGNATSAFGVTAAGTWDGTNGVGQLLSVNASGVPTWTNTIDGGTF